LNNEEEVRQIIQEKFGMQLDFDNFKIKDEKIVDH
jgi:hypothetical protein